MTAVPVEDRVKNGSSPKFSSNERCGRCDDDGWVVFSLRLMTGGYLANGKRIEQAADAYVDEMAPCPACERGYYAEFPKSGKPGPWGPAGFWRGREVPA